MPQATQNTVDVVVDIYHKSNVNLQILKDAGIVGIIHKASQGLGMTDDKYKERRDKALSMGFLWGAYHFSSADSPKKQAKHFLASIEWGKNPDRDKNTLMSLDYEPSGKDEDGQDLPNMTLDGACEFVTEIHNQTGRWPMIYGGDLLRRAVKGKTPDIVVANCPLWYARYRDTPVDLPTHIWPTYTLWQYSDGKSGPEPRLISGKRFDRDTFVGTVTNLRQKWPF
ncbi:UNVERIFIED_ORG: lysozyme [Burkholderia sp. CF145]